MSTEEIQSLCAELGIDAEYEKPLLWLVEVGMQSPLPPRYEVGHSPDGYLYYIDNDTQQSQWENPLLPYIKQVVDVGRLYLENPYQHVINEQVNAMWSQFQEGLREWHGPYIAEGRQYFVNSVRNISTWEDPRIEAQYLCELQSALIQKLQTVIPPQIPESSGMDGVRPGTPDFAQFASPLDAATGDYIANSADDELASGGSPTAGSLQQLRAAMASKLGAVDFRGEAEKDRVKMIKSMTDAMNLVYDLIEEEKEMQMLQMERKKHLCCKDPDEDGTKSEKPTGLQSPKGSNRKRISFSKMMLDMDEENAPPSPKAKKTIDLSPPLSPGALAKAKAQPPAPPPKSKDGGAAPPKEKKEKKEKDKKDKKEGDDDKKEKKEKKEKEHKEKKEDDDKDKKEKKEKKEKDKKEKKES